MTFGTLKHHGDITMSLKKDLIVERLRINGAVVGTTSGKTRPGSKIDQAFAALQALEKERQTNKRLNELATILIRNLKIRDDRNLVGMLDCGVAKSSFEVIREWVVTDTASLKCPEELYDADLVDTLKRKLRSLLSEYENAG